MTNVTVSYKHNRLVSIEASGHADFADHGEDIVCAAISVLMQTAVNSLETVAGLQFVIVESDETSGYMYIELPADLEEAKSVKADIVLNTVLTGLQGIAKAYPKYMRLLKKGGANIQ
ncbi:MAG: ribosomal-processing cysteine protease Prp [Clostridiales bacterium]|nr:ribosomal-processing cysteine protease Prp [Clostridiales bacterium]